MRKSILTTLVLVVLAVVAAQAQSTTTTATSGTPKSFTQKVNLLAKPVVTDGGGGPVGAVQLNEVTFDFDTDAEYTNGISNVPAHNFKIGATSTWTVNVKTATQYFSALVDPTNNNTQVAASKLAWSIDNGQTYTGMSNTDAILKTGGVGAATLPANQFDVMYKLDPGYIPNDTYSITVVYTLTAL